MRRVYGREVHQRLLNMKMLLKGSWSPESHQYAGGCTREAAQCACPFLGTYCWILSATEWAVCLSDTVFMFLFATNTTFFWNLRQVLQIVSYSRAQYIECACKRSKGHLGAWGSVDQSTPFYWTLYETWLSAAVRLMGECSNNDCMYYIWYELELVSSCSAVTKNTFFHFVEEWGSLPSSGLSEHSKESEFLSTVLHFTRELLFMKKSFQCFDVQVPHLKMLINPD